MLGDILKEARKKQGLTLSALGKQVGVTAGYISNLEHNRLEPSLSVLSDLAEKLNIPPSHLLFGGDEAPVVVCRRNGRPTAVFSNLPAPCEVLTPFSWRSRSETEIDALHLFVPPGTGLRTDEPALGSDEFVYVMSGKLEYSHGDNKLTAEAGEGIFVPDMAGRTLINAGDNPAEILWIAKSEIDEAGRPNVPEPLGAEADDDDEIDDAENGAQSAAMSFTGGNIRKLRKDKGMTVSALADKIGMTTAYVSKVERGLIEPSLPVLRKVTEALDVEMVYLFTVSFPVDAKVSKVFDRVDEFTIPGGNANTQLLTPPKLANGDRPHIFIMGVRLGGGQVDYEEFVVHDFAEFTYVVEGTLEYRTDKGNYLARAGDAVYLRKNVPHLLSNPGKRDCKFIVALGSIAHRYAGA
ncbi:MAG: helix-turn-helix domain-containing protein [Clostridiales Family XIII bacterium]|jgi:transcriptional regulator with XRE-family HTH domain/uncharacterized cupin superfamily protein|nr:helix-turn-helix domain-containing protein [Clostridiales Family XIII bacterium]